MFVYQAVADAQPWREAMNFAGDGKAGVADLLPGSFRTNWAIQNP